MSIQAVQIGTRVPGSLRAELQSRANDAGTSLSDYVRSALHHHIESDRESHRLDALESRLKDFIKSQIDQLVAESE